MKTLIIGGAGFVGGYLIEHLKTSYDWDIAVTKLPHETIDTVDDSIRAFDLDILDKDSIVSLLNIVKPDYIFHLAAQSSVALSWQNPALTVDINIKGND